MFSVNTILVPTDRSVLFGAPASEIIRFAREKEVDLIVIGTHGLKGVSRFFFGSVAHAEPRPMLCPQCLHD